MDGIRINVVGNIAKVIEKPSRITSGTVGLPIEFEFDSQWEGLSKTALFRAGNVIKIVENLEVETVVPWEVLVKYGPWLSVGVYGTNRDGTEVIPTIWANVSPIYAGVDPDGDPSTDPTLPVWQKLLSDVGNLPGLHTEAKDNLVEAVNEAYHIAAAGGVGGLITIGNVTLSVSGWSKVGENIYSQPVAISGITAYSKVDLLPSAEQLGVFRNMGLTLVTENDNGNVTVFAIGNKPAATYTMDVQIASVKDETDTTKIIGNTVSASQNPVEALLAATNMTEQQQTQARFNIGAAGSAFVGDVYDDLNKKITANSNVIAEIENDIGNMDSALDAIIAMQESIIGGESV